jgi:hypothetical protein
VRKDVVRIETGPRQPEIRLARAPNVPTPRSMIERHALTACHQCMFDFRGMPDADVLGVTMMLPSDGIVLGLSKQQTLLYGRILLPRAYQDELFLISLALYRLSALPSAKDPGSGPWLLIDKMRVRFLRLVAQRVAEGNVDDVLIHSICCAIPVDSHLGLLEYAMAHLRGLETLIKLRGGLSEVGSTYDSLGWVLREVVLHVMATTKLSVCSGSQIQHWASNPDDWTDRTSLSAQGCTTAMPDGVQALVDCGSVSSDMIVVLSDFQTWLSGFWTDAATMSPAWRRRIPDTLTDLERTLFLALICLADDLTRLGDHPGADLWRKSHQRALEILEAEHLWKDSRNADCLLWIATVVSLPDKRIPLDVWDRLQDRVLRSRSDIATVGDITRVLRRFFAPVPRLTVWLNHWHAKLS